MKILRLLVLVLLLSCYVFADNLVVKDVNVNGLKKTRKKTFLRMVGIIAGDMWSDDLKRTILRRLNNAGTFEEVGVEVKKESNGVSLLFNVKEKWSLVGFPMITGGGGSQFGAVAVDSNFLGTQSVGAVMAGVRSGKPQLFGYYSDPWFLSWRNYLTILAGYSGSEIGDFERNTWVAGIEAGHRFSEYFSVGAGLKFENYKHDKDKAVVPEDGKSYIFSLKAKYDKLNIVEDTFNGFTSEVVFQKNTWWSDFGYYKLFARASWFAPTVSNHTFAAMISGGVSDAPYGHGYTIGGQGGEGTVPIKGIDDNEYIAAKVLSGSLEYRVPVYKTRTFCFLLQDFMILCIFPMKKG